MSYIAERRQEEKDRRRAEIVDAAEALYAETGWDAITMDQVARRARLSRALLYVYFNDKGDLHLALVERALEALCDRFEAAKQDHPSGIAEVEAIGRKRRGKKQLRVDEARKLADHCLTVIDRDESALATMLAAL